MKPITLHYSEELVRRAVLAFWLRVTGWRFGVAIVMCLGSLIYLLEIGDRSWYVGVLGTVMACAVFLAVAIYVVHYRASFERFRRMKIPESTFEPSEEKFRITSDVGSTELSWRSITEVWCYPDFWLVFFSRSQFITLPTTDLDAESRDFILSHIKSNGGKIP